MHVTSRPPDPGPDVSGRIPGWKVARIIVADDAAMRFAGLAANSVNATFYDAEASAHCSLGKPHKVPSWDCSCGFHVARNLGELEAMYPDWDQPMFALLEVETWGDVVEHDNGLRVQHQRVLGASLADWCTFCGEPAGVLGAHFAAPASGLRYGATDLIHLIPICEPCNRRHCLGRTFSRAEIAGKIGVEVSTRKPLEKSVVPKPTRRGDKIRSLATGTTAFLAGLLAAASMVGSNALAGTFFLSSLLAGVAATRISMLRAPKTKTALTYATFTSFLLAVVAVLGVTSEPADITSAAWFEAAKNAAPTLSTDPYQAFQQIAALDIPYDIVPIGDDEGVTGIVAFTEYAIEPQCVIFDRTGDILFEGTLGTNDCLLQGRELLD